MRLELVKSTAMAFTDSPWRSLRMFLLWYRAILVRCYCYLPRQRFRHISKLEMEISPRVWISRIMLATAGILPYLLRILMVLPTSLLEMGLPPALPHRLPRRQCWYDTRYRSLTYNQVVPITSGPVTMSAQALPRPPHQCRDQWVSRDCCLSPCQGRTPWLSTELGVT